MNIPSIRAALFALVVLVMSSASFGQIGISVSFGPPALPVYDQPVCPGDGYIWTPGYWAYDSDEGDYYWVPGTWVEAPEVGFLWTPGYWGWRDSGYYYNEGYWGPHVGFYGGISYGFGYFGEGYQGGRWDNGHFFYNRSVNNVNVTVIHNVYNTTVINNTTTVNRVSYNGGNGGIKAGPRPEDQVAERERHVPPVSAQAQHVQAARTNPQLRASVNQGRPAVAATSKPGEFQGHDVVAAKEAGAPYHPPANRPAAQPRANEPASRPEGNASPSPTGHAKDIQPHERPAAPNTGNSKQDQKYQQQQEKLYAKQQQDHQKLQQKQEQEHQKMAQRPAPAPKTQQIEQKHQQQTQQMEQRHTQQQQQLQQRQPPPSRSESRPPKGKQ